MYGGEFGVLFYTHVFDQYALSYTKVINSPVHEATHVLDGLLHHESNLLIEEHYSDTAGFIEHVIGLCPFVGYAYAPRIADFADKNLYVPGKSTDWPVLVILIRGSVNEKLVEREFDDVLCLVAPLSSSGTRSTRSARSQLYTSMKTSTKARCRTWRPLAGITS
ncbi:hypothetical protein WS62_13200 [Burkholderia sp. ABCPW 14]|nr:hypothetical protein WS62_13200 [Burkholderia sp. ABCPW 14]